MSKPIPYFNFNANGLSVDFTNKTINTVDSCLWDFGFSVGGVEQTSNLQNPQGIIFPSSGYYNVSLSCTNADGTGVFTFSIYLSELPVLNMSISEMVLAELPFGVSINDIYYSQLIKKWQLYLQGPLGIADADVYSESKWPPLANVLIAKLIIYDLSLLAQKNLMVSVQKSVGSTSTILLSDYSITLDFSIPITINSIQINSIDIPGDGTYYSDANSLVNWLNTLNKGQFIVQGNNILSNSNENAISILTYTKQGIAGAIQVLFSQSNQRISNSNISNTTGSNTMLKGPVKRIETGPSNAEWFDISQYWEHILRSGIMDNLKQDACAYAQRVGVKLYFCIQPKTTKIFITGHKNC